MVCDRTDLSTTALNYTGLVLQQGKVTNHICKQKMQLENNY